MNGHIFLRSLNHGKEIHNKEKKMAKGEKTKTKRACC